MLRISRNPVREILHCKLWLMQSLRMHQQWSYSAATTNYCVFTQMGQETAWRLSTLYSQLRVYQILWIGRKPLYIMRLNSSQLSKSTISRVILVLRKYNPSLIPFGKYGIFCFTVNVTDKSNTFMVTHQSIVSQGN